MMRLEKESRDQMLELRQGLAVVKPRASDFPERLQ